MAELSVTDALHLARNLNRTWDQPRAAARIADLSIPPGRKVGSLSGGQQAQLALTVALAKRPQLLILDEPIHAETAAWAARNHLTFWWSYQPASRYWVFQGTESAALVLLALILGTATILLVRRRRA